MNTIYYCYFSSPIGRLLLLAQHQRLTNLDFEWEQLSPHPHWRYNPHLPIFQQAMAMLGSYFNHQHPNFAQLAIAPQGTVFQQLVWQQLQHIPYGEIRTYSDIATQLQRPQAQRPVGGAVARNPLSIIIPCHRVLGKKRQLTGFGGTLAVKRYLLKLEGIDYCDQGVEFVQPKSLKKYNENSTI